MEDYYGKGTHTGEPFAFGPYPPLPPKGVQVQDEPIQLTLTVTQGKIAKCEVVAHGNQVGPPGFYSKLGGILF